MSVGITTAMAQLRAIVEDLTLKTNPRERFVHVALDLEAHRRIRDRDFTIKLRSSPELAWLTGRAHLVKVRIVVAYKNDPEAYVRAAEDLGILQRTLVDPRNHGGPLNTGIISVRPPDATSFDEADGGALLARLDFSLIYLEAA